MLKFGSTQFFEKLLVLILRFINLGAMHLGNQLSRLFKVSLKDYNDQYGLVAK